MRTIKLTLQYDGGQFFGFQKQKTVSTTVQQILESKLSDICSSKIAIKYAGRTDRGVHAKCQVIVFEDSGKIPFSKLVQILTRKLKPFVVVNLELVSKTFDPRRDAVSRQYEYWMYQGVETPFLNQYMLHVEELNIKKLNRLAAKLKGQIDCKYLAYNSQQYEYTDRIIYEARFDLVPYQFLGYEGQAIRFTIAANSFLQHMVRKIVGLLLHVGAGKMTEQAFLDVINAQARHKWEMAPPEALFLSAISYSTRDEKGEKE